MIDTALVPEAGKSETGSDTGTSEAGALGDTSRRDGMAE
jgi:hypothetical protein